MAATQPDPNGDAYFLLGLLGAITITPIGAGILLWVGFGNKTDNMGRNRLARLLGIISAILSLILLAIFCVLYAIFHS